VLAPGPRLEGTPRPRLGGTPGPRLGGTPGPRMEGSSGMPGDECEVTGYSLYGDGDGEAVDEFSTGANDSELRLEELVVSTDSPGICIGRSVITSVFITVRLGDSTVELRRTSVELGDVFAATGNITGKMADACVELFSGTLGDTAVELGVEISDELAFFTMRLLFSTEGSVLLTADLVFITGELALVTLELVSITDELLPITDELGASKERSVTLIDDSLFALV
jgi:hypothetical protein